MNIGEAVNAMQAGKKVARLGWNGKGMFLMLHGACPTYMLPLKIDQVRDFVVMACPEWTYVVPWTCSQTDLLANDWVTVE